MLGTAVVLAAKPALLVRENWSAGKYAIIENTENHQIWGVDRITKKWLRVY